MSLHRHDLDLYRQRFAHYVEIGQKWLNNYFRSLSTLSHIGNENFGRYPKGSGKRPYQHTGKQLRRNGIIKAGPDVVKKSISSGAISTSVKHDSQARHCEDTRVSGRSYLYGDIDTAQQLIDELSTTGEPVCDENGNWTRKERVSSGRIIGVHVDDTTGETAETSKAMIHYSKRGAHIMPRKDDNDD